MKTIDTHAHLQVDAYDADRDEVIKRTLAADITCINVGTSFETSKKAVELAQKHDSFYAAIGLHPTDVDEPFDAQQYRGLAKSKKVVAVGEIGLDYFRPPFDKEKQKQVFLQQLDLARELNLPVILHCRMAHEDVIDILKSQTPMTNSQLRGVVHCFTGTLEQAKKYVELGFYLGMNGIMFKFPLEEVIKNIPLEHLLLETDCPYLTPLPAVALAKAGAHGHIRNEPIFMSYTIQKIAELKNISIEEVATKTTENAKKLFGV